ncbi:microtubule associated protein-domain-containing protein [Absidia repens]|uniref:Microtubule associated protein-domain-containing protein n=1 Tax=Absidia repens TaxID=90262 RepID=A0A1X2IE91_9FUNG|nr:microtubule associated protein-domain-containing protein [Absidia repens]
MTMEELMDQIGLRFDQLTLIHEALGLTAAKRQEDTDQVCQAVVNLMDHHIKIRTDEKDAMQQQCQQTHDSIVHMKRLMGVQDDAVDSQDQHQQIPYALTLDKLTKEKDVVQIQYDQRLADVKELYGQLERYQANFGGFVNMQLVMTTDVDVSAPAMTTLKEEIQRCENEYNERTQQVDSGMHQIRHLWEILCVAPESDLDHLLEQFYKHQNDDDKKVAFYATLVNDQQLDNIMQTIAQLDELKQQREFRKQEIMQHLNRLWDRLQADTDLRDTFLQSNDGVTLADLQQYELELDRMLKLKSEKVQDFILDARNEMENLWNQLYFSQQERDAFEFFESDEYNDTLLEAHETEIERLKHMVEDQKYILDKVERHMKLLQEIQDFESNTNDPKRLFGKGQRDPGRLLREEKFRKRISKELPKSKRDLEGALREFQTFTGSPFTVYGEPYLDQLTADDKTSQSLDDQPPVTPKRATITMKKPPMTSPRHRSHPKMHFHTPQSNRTNRSHETISDTKNEWRRLDSQVSSTASILHRVRQNNIRKKERTRIPRSKTNSSSTQKQQQQHLMLSSRSIKAIDNDTNGHQQQRLSSDTTDSSTFSGSDNSTLIGKDYKKNENVAPPNDTPASPALIQQKMQMTRTFSERHALLFDDDDDVTLDLGIFDDGPDLSDMSDNDV